MLEFGLTGGIGSGKSTVSAMLSDRGAIVIDADAIVHDLQRPGELVFDAMVRRWGSTVVQESGALDRAAVARIVFSDPDELSALNAIVHPAVADETTRRMASVDDPGAIVVHDIPLLVLPGGELLTSRDHTKWSGIIVVDTPEELATERLMASRGLERAEIEQRMASQASRDDRRSVASFVIDNSSDLAALADQVDECWAWMTDLAEPSRVNDTEAQAAHIKQSGVDNTEAQAAHITPDGLDRPSGAVDTAEPSGAEDTGEER